MTSHEQPAGARPDDTSGHSHDHGHSDDHGHSHGPGGVSRRGLIAGGAGALFLAGAAATPGPAAAAAPTPAGLSSLAAGRIASGGAATATGADRVSTLLPGVRLLHADLHNHTLFSDGDGDPAAAFGSMRDAGLDVAALTDHSTLPEWLAELVDGVLPDEAHPLLGLQQDEWRRTGELADAADEPGEFTAIRGFEWSAPVRGHVNVWFSREYRTILSLEGMDTLYRWLARPSRWWLDGGSDGLFGFNHPGREPGRFDEFAYDARLAHRMVSLELFNRRDDYLFEGFARGDSSPLVACLRAGWRPGLMGVTDEHGTDWGVPEGKGRTGLWVSEHSREGVREAMLARRFFATRESGLRVAATADGVPFGGEVRADGGELRVRLDVDRGSLWAGKPLEAQLLVEGDPAPGVAAVEPVTVGTGAPAELRVPVDAARDRWLVLRLADPAEPNATPGPAGHPASNRAVAYASPWWLVA